MIKPGLESRKYLDYNKCIKYVEHCVGIDFRDYAEAFKKSEKGEKEERPYLDFWESILKRFDVKNGSILEIDMDGWLTDVRAPSWEKELVGYINDYFYEHKDSNGCLKFWIEW